MSEGGGIFFFFFGISSGWVVFLLELLTPHWTLLGDTRKLSNLRFAPQW